MGFFHFAVSSELEVVLLNPSSSAKGSKKSEQITVPHVLAGIPAPSNKTENDKNALLRLTNLATNGKDGNRRHAIQQGKDYR